MKLPKVRPIRRRGHYLLTFGVVQLLLGILAFESQNISGPESAGRAYFLWLLQPPLYLPASVLVFLLCVGAVLVRVPTIERYAFTALAAIAALRAGLLVVASIFGPGYVNTGLLSQALVFVLILRVHVLVAGWSEPEKILVLDEDDWRTIARELRRRLDGGTSE